MSMKDKRGLSVSTRNDKCLAKFDEAVELLNGYYIDPLAAIDEALAEDPDFVMGHCFKAGVFATVNEKSVEPELRKSLEAAEARSHMANDRERAHMAAARVWMEGDLHRGAELYGRILHDYPQDIVALQFAHQGDFFTGSSQMLRDRVAQVLPHWSEDTPGYGYVLGMHAFGLEETNMYRRAEETGRRAVEMNGRDPWAIHAVAHVMEMEGRLDDGIGWLATRTGEWADGNAFAFHNWWHLALYHMERGEFAEVLALYDQRIKPGPTPIALELVDGSALLWRLHLRGVDVGSRWKQLADAWEPMAEDAFYAFNDAHAMMCFVADGRMGAAKRTLAALERRVEGSGSNAGMTRDVGLPLCRALWAFGQGDYDQVVNLLTPVRAIANRFGGSHAQRDVMHQTLIEAALRGGHKRLAQALVAERTDLKPASPYNRLLAQRAQAQMAA
jgi:hypothetical protein